MYTALKFHNPGQSGYKPAPPSRWNNPSGRVNVTVGAPANRPGKTYTPGKYKGDPLRKVTPRPALTPKPGKRYVPRSPAQVKTSVQQAIQRAFPYPRPFAGGGPARAFAATAARYAEAVAESQAVAEQVAGDLDYINDVLSGQWWQTTPPYSGLNPGLTYLGNRTHTAYGTLPGGLYSPPAGWGVYANAVDQRLLGQNTWLRSTVPWNATAPGGYLARTLDPSGMVTNMHYLYVANAPYWKVDGTSLDNYYASKDIYRNVTGAAIPAYVNIPGTAPLPLGVPLPAGLPSGFPLAAAGKAKAANPRKLPRPQRVDEVAIDITLGDRPRLAVYRGAPRKPGPNATEKKSYGKQGVAGLVFWLYEATDDWVDWVNIVVSAIPAAPAGMSPTQQLMWLRDNPAQIANANWGDVLTALAGWAVDEAFGAFVGEINKRASRSTAVSAQTVDMRNNVALHYSAAGTSPGQFVTAFLRNFL